MRSDVEAIVDTVSAWENITAAPHRFGGTEFNLGKVEIGHIHHNGMVDIPFTRSLREQLLAADEAEPHHLLPETGWISFYLRGDNTVAQALRLFRLSYLQKSRRRNPALTAGGLQAELTSLGFGDRVNALLMPEHDTGEADA